MEREIAFGACHWFFPDADLPPEGEGKLKGHESIIILNTNKHKVAVAITCYFEYPKKPIRFKTFVEAESVCCLRTNKPEHMGGNEIPVETQYAIEVSSDIPIIAQYGRLDNRQVNLAYYTTMGYWQ